jgi:pathogenesis-related protein 1
MTATLICLILPFAAHPAPNPPFPLDGKPVYVLSGTWREARLGGYEWDSRTGFRYRVVYADTDGEERGVTRDRIMNLADAARRGLVEAAHDVSSRAGVKEMLHVHNVWRQRYHVPPLAWSTKLTRYAQQWANTLLQNRRFEHRSNTPYGENLAEASGQQLTPTRVVTMWGNEYAHYDYSANSCAWGQMCGHFTQLVWKDTKEVGCGMARDSNREVWVCNYNPPGNIVGRKPY